MIYIGVDPGRTGAVAIITDVSIIITPFAKLTETDRIKVFMGFQSERFAFIEKVHSMPKDSAKNAFKFGRSYGFLRACLYAANIPFDQVEPAKWQRALGCLTGGDKRISKAKANQLFPDVKVTQKTADALLIAEYCRRVKEGSAR